MSALKLHHQEVYVSNLGRSSVILRFVIRHSHFVSFQVLPNLLKNLPTVSRYIIYWK